MRGGARFKALSAMATESLAFSNQATASSLNVTSHATYQKEPSKTVKVKKEGKRKAGPSGSGGKQKAYGKRVAEAEQCHW